MKGKPRSREPFGSGRIPPLQRGAGKRAAQPADKKDPGITLLFKPESLSRIIRIIPAPVMISRKKDGICIDASDSCLSLFGLFRREMAGRSVYELLSAENRASGKMLSIKLRRQGFLRKEPVTIRRAGDTRHALWSVHRMVNGDVMMSFFHDVTELRRMEARLAGSLDKYRDIFENIRDVYYEIRCDGTILEISPSIGNLSKWKRKDLLGGSIYGIYANPEGKGDPVKAVLKSGSVTDCEIGLKDKDGRLLNCTTSAALVCDKKGTRRKIIGFIRDVSASRMVEDQLRQNEAKYKCVVDNIGIGVALISPKMEILTLNPQMKKWFPGVDSAGRPLCYKSFNNPPRKSVCSNCPTFKTLRDGESHEWVTETPTGDAVRNFRIISTPIRDRQGKVTAAIEMVEDYTEKKRIQEQLEESEKWYRTIFETTSSGTLVIEEDLTISYMNKAFEKRTGFSKSEVEGKKKWTDFISADDLEAVRKFHNLRRPDPAAAPGRYETRYLCRGGSIRDVLATVAVIPGAGKSILSLMDITKLKKVERSLKEREEELSIKSRNLEELNAALKALLKQRDEDRMEMEENVLANVKNGVLPLIGKLQAGPLENYQSACLETLEAHLREIISPFLHKVSQAYFDLTPHEIQVAGFIKDGMTSKEIAGRLGVSIRTVDTHRDNIRGKLGIKNRKTSLRSFLMKFS